MSALIKWEPWGQEWLRRYRAGTHFDLQEYEKVDEGSIARMLPSRKPPQVRPGASSKSSSDAEEKSSEPKTKRKKGKKRTEEKNLKKGAAAWSSYFKPEPECRLDDYYSLMGLRKRGTHATEADIKK